MSLFREIEKGNIVRDDQDRKEYHRRMDEQAQGISTSIYAFALMSMRTHPAKG